MTATTTELRQALLERDAALATAGALAVQVSHLAQYDALTNLPNRVLLRDRLTRALALADRHGKSVAVLFLDLDRFKDINDSEGQVVGDQVLRAVAGRLTSCLRSSDTVSRHDGDEFLVLLSELEHRQHAGLGVAKIVAAVSAPLAVAGRAIHVTASIGISIFPDDGNDAEALIKSADNAMCRAKANGRNRIEYFDADMGVRASGRRSVEDALRGALEREEFVLHYQPKVNLESGAIVGAEALVRWRHPDRGLVLPVEFVSIAEESGLIAPIDRWVLREACRQARIWQDAGLTPIPVSVNVSAVDLERKEFVDDVSVCLNETGLEARYLELELTEGVLMKHIESRGSMLQALKTMGVELAIDDFGTGFSSLSYLTQLPIDALKLDQSFVHQLAPNPTGPLVGAGLILSAVIGMGNSLSYRVVAEGVETREQLAFLEAEHCGEGQGFYFSPAVVAERFARMLETGKAERT